MADLNHVVLLGRLTRDAELKYTASGQAVCKFSVAVNRRRKNGDQWEDEANFFDIVLWGRQGESLNQYLVKGKMIGVEGELRQDRWQQDGQNRSKVEIVANNIQLISGSGGANSGGGAYGGSGSNAAPGSSYGGSSGSFQGGHSEVSAAQGRRDAPPSQESGPDDGFANDIPF
ncbi:MAG: single-stranded DNA-binding protein [Treponema sp.]|jgi:single-strand DNA-binding protein|nr:single-stranded DNA-binding protein [Treponema sp.]